MPLRSILVHLDGYPRCSERLRFAAALAGAHGARLSGTFAQLAPPRPAGATAAWPGEQYRSAATASRNAFVTASPPNGNWNDLGRGSEKEIVKELAGLARNADLTVLGQPEPDSGHRLVPQDLCEKVILGAGTPVLVIPYAGHHSPSVKRPLVVWSNDHGASRALNDALQLFEPGAEILLLCTSSGEPGFDHAIAHLGFHGFAARTVHLADNEIPPMEMVLSRLADHGADLLVTGAFESHHLPFVNHDADTRFLLRHMTVPTLFSY